MTFGSKNGPKMGPKMDPKWLPKPRNLRLHFASLVARRAWIGQGSPGGSILGSFLGPFWDHIGVNFESFGDPFGTFFADVFRGAAKCINLGGNLGRVPKSTEMQLHRTFSATSAARERAKRAKRAKRWVETIRSNDQQETVTRNQMQQQITGRPFIISRFPFTYQTGFPGRVWNGPFWHHLFT